MSLDRASEAVLEGLTIFEWAERAERAEALADQLAEALRLGWPGISGESYDRPIQEVHGLVVEALAAWKEAREGHSG